MGVSKNKKRKNREITKAKKVDTVHQKCEKEKRFYIDNKFYISDSENTLDNLFKTDEQHELRRILKTNNLTCMPLILGATILGKFDVVKKLIKQGYDVNSTGFDKSTSLMWAVKTKNLEMIDLLVSRGADVTPADDSGENVIFMALNSPEWDENRFLDFWQSVKKMNEINLEFANKTGNRLLHFAVKKQWASLIESLIEDKVNINSCNNKGVSALTMAAARNDLKLVNTLLNADANVFQEDLKGNTPICYTIVNIVRKKLKPPYETYDRLTRNFTRENYERYIERRLHLLVKPPSNDLNSCYPNINKITTAVISFIMNQVQNGVDILLKLGAFEKLKTAIETHVNHFEYLQSLLSVTSLLLRWCECCTKINNSVLESEISDIFINSEVADILLFVLKVYSGSNSMKQLLPNVFLPLFLTCSTCLVARNWLKDHLNQLEEFYQQYLDICLVNFNIKEDDHHVQIKLKDKIKLFKETFDELKAELLEKEEAQASATNNVESSAVPIEEKFEQPVQHGRKYAKRMRRKARALKARIDKIRSADVVERIRIHSKNKASSSSCINNNISEEIVQEDPGLQGKEEKNDDKEIIEIKLNHPVDISSSESVEAPAVAINNEDMFANNFVTNSNSNDSGVLSQENSGLYEGMVKLYDDKENLTRNSEFAATMTRLQVMLNDIICKYKLLWGLDAQLGHPQFMGGQGDNIHPLLEGTREEQLKKLRPLLPFIERQYLLKLVDNFNKTIEKIKNLFLQNNESYKIFVEQLQHILAEHEIRGEKFLKQEFNKEDDPFTDELVEGKYGAIGDHLRQNTVVNNVKYGEAADESFKSATPGKYGAIGDHLRLDVASIDAATYMELIENVLPSNYQHYNQQLSAQDMLYLHETSSITFKPSTLTEEEREQIKKKTEDNAYHLLETACDVCDSDDNLFEDWDEEYISPYMKRMIQKAKEKKENFPIQKSNVTLASLKQKSSSSPELLESPERCGEIVPFCPESQNNRESETDSQNGEPPKVSRWESRIQSLQSILKQQMITKGATKEVETMHRC